MKLIIIETSDVHSYISTDSFKVRGQKEQHSLSRVKTYLDKVRNENKNVIYIDNGDNIQGSPLASLYHRTNSIENLSKSYNLLKPDAMVLGNHDFNYGKDHLNSYISHLSCPVLSANTIQIDDKILDIKPYIIKEFSNIKVGILGLVTQYIPHWENPKNIEGLKFQSALETAKYYVPYLKNKEACDIVIISYHGGLGKDLESGVNIYQETGENEGYDLLYLGLDFDVLLTGHNHQEISGIYNDKVVLQPGYAASKLGEVIFEIDEDKKIKDTQFNLVNLGDFNPSQELEDMILEDMSKTQDFLDATCGKLLTNAQIKSVLDAQLHGHPYISLVNQIQMHYTQTDIGSACIFLPDAKGLYGKVSMRDIISNYMFNNTLMKVEVSGKEFKQILEFNSHYFDIDGHGNIVINPEYFLYNYDIYSGVDYSFDISKPRGQRLVSAIYKNHEITDDEKITFATNSYRAIGGGDFPVLDGSQIIWESSQDIPQLIFDYIEEKKIVEINDYPSVNVIGY